MSISLKINDIIGINSKDNPYIIDYIDDKNIKLMNSYETLHFDIVDGHLNTTSIQIIYLLSRSNHGYAEEKGLIKNKWVEFMINDMTFFGQITNTDHDMIEIKVFPGNEELYIDFAYKGMPSFLQSIKLREQPSMLDSDEIEIEYGDKYLEYIELPDHLKRYAIETQKNDLLNDILSYIPVKKRDSKTMKTVAMIIDRFTYLREMYSIYNDRNEIETYKIYGHDYRPLKESLLNNMYVDWLVPIVNIQKPLYDADNLELMQTYLTIEKEFAFNSKIENHEKLLYSRLNDLFSCYEPIIDNDTLYYKEVNNNIYGLTKLEVYNKKGTRSNYPYLQMFNTGSTMLKNKKMVPLRPSDVISIVRFRKLPHYFIDFYKLKLPSTKIMERCYYNEYARYYWNDFKPYKYKLTDYNDKPDMEYNDYLHTMIHSTIDLLNKTKPSYTIQDIVYQLEPYLIYKEHLTIQHYESIHKKIKKNISTYQHNFNKLTDQFISLYNAYERLQSKPNSLIFDIIRRSEHNYVEKLNQYYQLDSIYSSSEHLHHILEFDGSKTYMTILSNMNIYSSHDIEHILKQVLGETKEEVKDTNKSDCTKLNEIYKKIVKQYTTLEDLKKDNHKPIIIEPVNLPPLYNLIINKLYETYPDIDSKEIDDILEEGKESLPTYVANGHYAILEDGKTTTYYKRSQDKWVETTMKNENTCELKQNCLTSKNQCVSNDHIKFQLKHELVNNMLNEFDHIKDNEYKTQTKKLLLKLKYFIEKLPYLKTYHNKQHLKYNQLYQSIASKLEDMNVEVSPYEPILNKILAINDNTIKYHYIIKFTNHYTREAHSDENEYWYYCIKTGVKLMPTFLFRLATVFEQDRDQFNDELEMICQSQGTLSDDGNHFVDKYSGLIIKQIQYNTEEGYDAKGFKIKSREIIEDDDIEIKHSISNLDAVIINTLRSIADNTGIYLSDENINEIKGLIKAYPFTSVSRTFLCLIYSYFFIFVQLNHLHPVKTFPGCVLSFDGYPIPEKDNTDGLNYLACVLKSMYNTGEMGNNKDRIIQNLKTTIQYILKKDVAVQLKYKNYVKMEHKEDYKFYDIHWDLFLPPLKNIELKFKPPSHAEIDKMNQHEIKSVMIYFSMLIIQGVQTVMNQFDPLLIRSTFIPYNSNACCNMDDIVVYDFLTKNNKDIETLNRKVYELSSLMIERTPCYIVNTENRLILPASIPNIFLEKTIYRAFIYMCKLNQSTPLIDTDLLQYCPSFKIDGLLDIDQQIELLKEKNVTYSTDAFNQLLNIMNHRNIITTVHLFYKLKDIQSLLDVLMIDSININQMGTLSNDYQDKIKSYLAMGSLKPSQKKQIQIFFEQRKLYNTTASTNELYLLMNYIHMIVRVIPYMIINNVEYKESLVPWERLKLSEKHGKHLMSHIQVYYESIMNLKNEYDIMEYMTMMLPILEKNYVNLLDIEWQSHEHINRLFNLYIDHIFMIYIRADKENIYNKLIVNVLYAFIENFIREIHYPNITEKEIQEKIEAIEREEKNEMTTRLKNMNEMQRRLSNVQKELKLGEWSVGLTTSLWKYDQEAYDAMVDKEMKKMIEDRTSEIAMLRGDVLYDGSIMRDDRDYNIEDENEATSEEFQDEIEY
jgi:hypothetical protein